MAARARVGAIAVTPKERLAALRREVRRLSVAIVVASAGLTVTLWEAWRRSAWVGLAATCLGLAYVVCAIPARRP